MGSPVIILSYISVNSSFCL